MFVSLKDYGVSVKAPQNAQIEGLQNVNTAILDGSFFTLVIGLPGQGKSWLLQSMLSQKDLYGGQFDYVFYVSPQKYNCVTDNDETWTSSFDIQWVYDRVQALNEMELKKHVNVLFVFDDVINSVRQQINSKFVRELWYNRRHLLKNGTVSIIMSSQRWMDVPHQLRQLVDNLFLFDVSKMVMSKIQKEKDIPYVSNMDHLLTKIKQTPYDFLYVRFSTMDIYWNFKKILK